MEKRPEISSSYATENASIGRPETGFSDSYVKRGVRVRRNASTSSGRNTRSAVAPGCSVNLPVDGLVAERAHAHVVGARVAEGHPVGRLLAQRALLVRQQRAHTFDE